MAKIGYMHNLIIVVFIFGFSGKLKILLASWATERLLWSGYHSGIHYFLSMLLLFLQIKLNYNSNKIKCTFALLLPQGHLPSLVQLYNVSSLCYHHTGQLPVLFAGDKKNILEPALLHQTVNNQLRNVINTLSDTLAYTLLSIEIYWKSRTCIGLILYLMNIYDFVVFNKS